MDARRFGRLDDSRERIPEIFLGKRIRMTKDISDAIWFASRMLVLRQKLADRLVELISVV